MPLYEFQCDACGKRFEYIQKSFSDEPLEVCTLCGKGPVHRLLSSPAIQFKGSGFYITDYAKKGTSDAGTKSDKSEQSDKGEKTDKGEKSSKGESGGSAETKSASTDSVKATVSSDTTKSPSPSSSTPSAPSSTSSKNS
ncbi:MAG: zinc ribbon domain-containing protein [Acidobacteria bacterium]|nr:zinc ribbon domain-containing protein [Acidobacteriota bacterium]